MAKVPEAIKRFVNELVAGCINVHAFIGQAEHIQPNGWMTFMLPEDKVQDLKKSAKEAFGNDVRFSDVGIWIREEHQQAMLAALFSVQARLEKKQGEPQPNVRFSWPRRVIRQGRYAVMHPSHVITDEVLRRRHTSVIMNTYTPQHPYLSPDKLAAKLRLNKLSEFSEVFVTSTDPQKTPIGLWVKKPDDDKKPVYVLFHGRTGHWGYCDDYETPEEAANPYYRAHLLAAAAETGAGVIAVHSRGFGMSNPELYKNGEKPHKKIHPDKHLDLSERAFQRDTDAVAHFILNDYKDKAGQAIAPQRFIVAGESFGGALAAMLAETMTHAHQASPKVLGLISTFDTLPNAVLPHAQQRMEKLRGKVFRWEEDQPITAKELESRIPERFYTFERIKRMIKGKTSIYIAHPPDDPSVSFDHALRNAKAAQDTDLHYQFRRLEGERMLEKAYFLLDRKEGKNGHAESEYVEVPKYPHTIRNITDIPASLDNTNGFDKARYDAEMAGIPQGTRIRYPHTSWNPGMLVTDMNDMFHDRPLQPSEPLKSVVSLKLGIPSHNSDISHTTNGPVR